MGLQARLRALLRPPLLLQPHALQSLPLQLLARAQRDQAQR